MCGLCCHIQCRCIETTKKYAKSFCCECQFSTKWIPRSPHCYLVEIMALVMWERTLRDVIRTISHSVCYIYVMGKRLRQETGFLKAKTISLPYHYGVLFFCAGRPQERDSIFLMSPLIVFKLVVADSF